MPLRRDDRHRRAPRSAGALAWRAANQHVEKAAGSLRARRSGMSYTLAPLGAIVTACLAGGVLSVLAAAGTLALHSRWISPLVSFAVGALLGAVFLELLPH